MASPQKQKEHDTTGAFLKNERHQKRLYAELEQIDKQWCNQLKILSRDRLETTSELIRLEDEKGQLEYFDENMDTQKMKEYTDICFKNMKELQRELSHDNFNFDNHSAIYMKKNSHIMNLPKLEDGCFVTKAGLSDKKTNRPNKNRLRKRRKSNLLKSKIFSMSDSNLDKVSKFKQETSEVEIPNKTQTDFKPQISPTQKTLLPDISERVAVRRTNEQHRYLKERMATTLVLPTVREDVSRQRKNSV